MPTTDDLLAAGFTSSAVTAKRLNIDHHDPANRGPFCRLVVATTAAAAPGVYAWVTDDDVQYVGKAKALLHVVQGQRHGRAYNDYTYMPASKVQQLSSPRVSVNGLLNRALGLGQVVTWWWTARPSEDMALDLEADLIARWEPPWNRARPRR